MQNLTAPLTEGNKVYSSYYKTGAIDEALTFIIPVYKNMPSTKVSKPNPGNPNYYLKSISVNGLKDLIIKRKTMKLLFLLM